MAATISSLICSLFTASSSLIPAHSTAAVPATVPMPATITVPTPGRILPTMPPIPAPKPAPTSFLPATFATAAPRVFNVPLAIIFLITNPTIVA